MLIFKGAVFVMACTQLVALVQAVPVKDRSLVRSAEIGAAGQVVFSEDTHAEHRSVPDDFYGYVSRRARSTDPGMARVLLELPKGAPSLPLLVPPSTRPYSFNEDRADFSYSQYGQDQLLAPIFDKMGTGFFVESGACDGEKHSNTIFLEHKGWKGLLIEPSRIEYPKIASKHRKAYAFQGCLSPSEESETLHLFDSGDGVSNVDETASFISKAEPLAKLLEPLQQKTVDFWSLDIEGSEGPVLESTDFVNIEVGLLMIEMNKGTTNNERILAVMKKQGFVQIGTTEYTEGGGYAVLDRIFANPQYFEARGLKMPENVNNPNHLR